MLCAVHTKEGCEEFAQQYAGEFARRYADCEYIFGVDLMNEPDWVYENAECGMTCAEKYKSAYENGWSGVMV